MIFKHILLNALCIPFVDICRNPGTTWVTGRQLRTLLASERRCYLSNIFSHHYGDVLMSTIASQITSLTIVYSTVYPDADKEKIKVPRHWPLCGIHRDRWIPRTKGQLRGIFFHLIASSWFAEIHPTDRTGVKIAPSVVLAGLSTHVYRKSFTTLWRTLKVYDPLKFYC